MDDRVRTGQQLIDRGGVAHVAVQHVERIEVDTDGRDRLQGVGGIHEQPHVMTRGTHRLDSVRAQEAGASGDGYEHPANLVRRR